MKKILILILSVFLTACSWGNFDIKKDDSQNSAKNSVVQRTLHDEYVQAQIKILQKQVDKGQITPDEAGEKLKKFVKDLPNLNDGSTRSILKKFELIDPETAKLLEERIRKNHPEALAE